MHYGDTVKYHATKGDEVRRFILERSGGAASNGYKLYGYDPDQNARNFLEDFGINGNPTHHDEVMEGEERIRFYVGEDWLIKMHPPRKP